MPDKRVLLHVCCANCAAGCLERLAEEGYTVELLYANSNILNEEEFEKRKQDAVRLAEENDLILHELPYDHEDWLREIRGLESEPEQGERCLKCFAYNLQRTAEKAASLDIPFFTTTLTVSPHKRSPDIFRIGEELEGFLPLDFKKKDGFKKSLELSKRYGFYRQTFCGCEFSLRGSRA